MGDSYEHGAKTIRYPDLIENGRLRTGCYLLVIDVSVTNNDAITYTKDDFDEDGIPQGLYSDPYLFHADGLFYLHGTHIGDNGVITHTDPDGTKYTSISCYTADYFSLTDNRPEDRTVFRVAHGETLSFSVGCLVFDEDAGGEYDLSTLYLTKNNGQSRFLCSFECTGVNILCKVLCARKHPPTHCRREPHSVIMPMTQEYIKSEK